MHPRCWLLHRSKQLEHNQCHSLYFFSELYRDFVKEQLEKLVLQIYRDGTRYSEAVREFQRAFLATVLREHGGNQVRAAKRLGMHRNTIRRHIMELELDIQTLRVAPRRPPSSERLVREKEENYRELISASPLRNGESPRLLPSKRCACKDLPKSTEPFHKT